MSALRFWLSLALVVSLAGCGATRHRVLPVIDVHPSQRQIPEDFLLDVGIETFDPGLDGDEAELAEEGVFPGVRKAEARFIAVHLRNTLQETAQWGAVRIVPPHSDAVEVTVRGQIIRSNGEELKLFVEVFDSTGRIWLKETYKATANDNSYAVQEVTNRDPFQNVYNQVANDMVKARNKLTPRQITGLRNVSHLRFAANLAPKPFASYLALNNQGEYFARKLPSRDDPMLQRIDALRQRDFMLIDTLNEHYAHFSTEMSDSYQSWRKFSYEETVALNEQNQKALIEQVLGVAIVAGGIAAAAVGVPAVEVLAPTILGGAWLFKKGMDTRSESAIHADAIRELGASLDSEVTPMLIEVEGQTMELRGSADEQYMNWRRLLRQIYSSETGFPTGGDAPSEPTLASPPSGA